MTDHYRQMFGRVTVPRPGQVGDEKHFPEPVILNDDTITITVLRTHWRQGERYLEIDLIYPDGMKQSISRKLPVENDPWIGEICSMRYKIAFESAVRRWWSENGRANLEDAYFMNSRVPSASNTK